MDSYSAGWAAVAGLVGGIAFLLVVYMGRSSGMTRMDFLYILGTMMTPGLKRPAAYVMGFMMHMAAAAGFGLLHAALLHAIEVETVGAAAGWDLLIGAAHGLVVLVAMPMMLMAMHPLVQQGRLEQPGPAMTGFGPMTPVGSLMAHAAFGVVTGTLYAAAVL